LKTRQSQAMVYKQDHRAAPHVADSGPAGLISPQYRGFIIRCLAGELPAKQRQINEFWDRQYFSAMTPAGRQAVVDQEREWRDAPREWV
jgi:hypothetical protein